MPITAKVKLTSKGEPNNGQVPLGFMPDYDDGANKEWAKATPSLSLSMAVLAEVADKFDLGAAYTLTFTESD